MHHLSSHSFQVLHLWSQQHKENKCMKNTKKMPLTQSIQLARCCARLIKSNPNNDSWQ